MLQKDAGKKLHDNEIEIRKQSLELMREKKRSTDLESELLSMQGIADSQNTHIRDLEWKLEEKSKECMENLYRYQIMYDDKIQEVDILLKQLQNLKMEQQQKEGQLLQASLDLWIKDESLEEMKSRDISLQNRVDKLKQGRLQFNTSTLGIRE